MPKEIKFQGNMDDRNRITGLKTVDASHAKMGALMNLIGGAWLQFCVLPEQAVKVGDAWDYVVPKQPVYGDKEFTLKAKFTGEKTVAGAQAWVMTLDGVLPMDMDLATLMGNDAGESATEGARLTGPVEFHMEAAIEKATGRLLEAKATGKGKQSVDIPAMGAAVDINGTTTAKWTLVPPTPPKATCTWR